MSSYPCGFHGSSVLTTLKNRCFQVLVEESLISFTYLWQYGSLRSLFNVTHCDAEKLFKMFAFFPKSETRVLAKGIFNVKIEFTLCDLVMTLMDEGWMCITKNYQIGLIWENPINKWCRMWEKISRFWYKLLNVRVSRRVPSTVILSFFCQIEVS